MQTQLKTIKIIHFFSCIGLVAAYLIVGEIEALFEFGNLEITPSNLIYVLVPFIAYLTSNFLFRTQLKKINQKIKLEDKMPFYQTASIIRWSILEGAAFLLLFLKKEFLLLGILIIVYLGFIAPSEDKIKKDLKEKEY